MFSEDDLTKQEEPKVAGTCRPWRLCETERDVKMLGESGEKTLPTKQAYFGGAFNLKGKFQITQGQSGSCIRFQTKGDVLERTKRFEICT